MLSRFALVGNELLVSDRTTKRIRNGIRIAAPRRRPACTARSNPSSGRPCSGAGQAGASVQARANWQLAAVLEPPSSLRIIVPLPEGRVEDGRLGDPL